MPIPTKRKYNVIADVRDDRDCLARIVSPSGIPLIPQSSDLSTKFPPVYDQGNEGSCTAHGWTAAIDFQRHVQGEPFLTPSRQLFYGEELVMEGDPGQDNGAQVRTGAKVGAKVGVAPESMFPYTPADFTKPWPKGLLAEAKKHRILKYERVAATPEAICTELSAGFPVVMGFTVFASFESPDVAKTGVLHMPAKGEAVLGGHCTVFVGHNITERNATALLDGTLKVRNSWGVDWGQSGYFTMPFGYLKKGYVSDCWAIRSTIG